MVVYPHIWGEGGALFAYSGMDGATASREALIGSTLSSGRGFVFHSRARPSLRFGVRSGEADVVFDATEDEIVAGGLVVTRLRIANADLKLEYVWVDCATLAARVSAVSVHAPVEVFLECAVDGAAAEAADGAIAVKAGDEVFALSAVGGRASAGEGRVYGKLSREGDCIVFGWSRGSLVDIALQRAASALRSDVDALVGHQRRFFERLPQPTTSDETLLRAYYKCASVMKVNCCSAEPHIRFPWTTPDRWPHRNMWIWDSAFHAIGLRHFAPGWAEDAIRAVLSVQREDGFIPHMITADGTDDSDIIQPPILAWASEKVYEKTRSRGFLEYVYPRIRAMLSYDCDALDADRNGLSGWESGGASGMDNSPRFDQPHRDAIDLNCYIVNDLRCLARIAAVLGLESDVADMDAEADERASRINSNLWDPESGFYYDAAPDGSLVRIRTEAGLTPLFAGVCTRHRAEALIRHLADPREFWRPLPVSSVAADEPTFSDNMWRGPVWVNFNYFFIEGLRRYGRPDIAGELRRLTLREIARWNEADGLIYEYYDSERDTSPVYLHRKARGGPDARRSEHPLGTTICDYNWTAAIFIDLLMEGARSDGAEKAANCDIGWLGVEQKRMTRLRSRRYGTGCLLCRKSISVALNR